MRIRSFETLNYQEVVPEPVGPSQGVLIWASLDPLEEVSPPGSPEESQHVRSRTPYTQTLDVYVYHIDAIVAKLQLGKDVIVVS